MIDSKQKKLKKTLEHRVLKNSETYILKLLDEGEIFSYRIDKFEPFLKKIFAKLEKNGLVEDVSFERVSDPKNDIDILNVAFVSLSKDFSKNKEDLKQELHNVWEHGFNLHGWFLGSIWKDNVGGKEKTVASFEPKYPLENDKIDERTREEIKKFKKFYHVSFPKYRQKILKNGLIPSISHRKDFMYPERLYLFGRKELADVFADYHFKTKKGIEQKYDAQILRVKGGKDKQNKIADMKFQTVSDEIDVYEVDLERMLSDGKKKIRLYHDNRFFVLGKNAEKDKTSAAFFTYNQIDPKYVSLKYKFGVMDSIDMADESKS